jgi:hypothetical protein
MARRRSRPLAAQHETLDWPQTRCDTCQGPLWVAYHDDRTVVTLDGLLHLTLRIRRCRNRACPQYHRPCRPPEEGRLVLPQAEFGLDVIALIGALRYQQQRSVPEIHQELDARGVDIAMRTVTNLVQRYEELVSARHTDDPTLRERLHAQGRVILAIDGLQPDVGHEVLWILHDCLSGEILLARSLLSAAEADLSALLREVQAGLPVPITAVISDGQQSLRRAIAAALPDVPHQLCHFHYLREAAQPVFEADRHAKKVLKKLVRDIRPIERTLEGRDDDDATATRGYCQAVRSALTDDGRPPLAAAGIKLADRLQAIETSIERVSEKRGSRPSLLASTAS